MSRIFLMTLAIVVLSMFANGCNSGPSKKKPKAAEKYTKTVEKTQEIVVE